MSSGGTSVAVGKWPRGPEEDAGRDEEVGRTAEEDMVMMESRLCKAIRKLLRMARFQIR